MVISWQRLMVVWGFVQIQDEMMKNDAGLLVHFLAFLAFFGIYVNAKSISRSCDSSNTLSITSTIMRFCLWTSLLLNGDSVAVTLAAVFMDSVISINFELTILCLFVNNLSVAPYICIHDLKIALRAASGCFDLAKLGTYNIVALSLKCSKMFPS